ncbi:hypothetical protein [Arthrobacter sp. NPDC057013]|uniref:hypothetical protein n=1 Tax=Arthrobacter sp. NPDC057013 TaxID=3345999 RepID=UPI0036365EC1
MPVIEHVEDDPVPEIYGVPGLRRRPHELGLSLFRPGLTGEVVVTGMSVGEWEGTHAAEFCGPHAAVCPATSHPGEWTEAEENHARSMKARFGALALRHQHDDYILQSAMFRRIGLLNRLGSRSTTTWRKARHPGIVVELYQDEYNFDSHESFIREMTSPHMSPKLTCVDRRIWPDRNYRFIEFATPRSEGSIQVRLAPA